MDKIFAEFLSNCLDTSIPVSEFIPGDSYITSSGMVLSVEDRLAMIDQIFTPNGGIAARDVAREFEYDLSKYLGVTSTVLTNSGSSANLLALAALFAPELGSRALREGDEVITCAVGFPTTVAPIVQLGLIPVFVDAEYGTYVPLSDVIEDAITPQTRVLFLAHTLGNPINVLKMQEIADAYNLWVIYDSCDALGTKYKGKSVAEYGDMSTYSFYPAHHITMGEGGAVSTNNAMLNKIVRSLRDWGRSCFPEGTLITSLNGQTRIEDVITGDKVLTHTGKYKEVSEVLRSDYYGDMYTIKPVNMPEIVCTEDHPFFVQRDDKKMWVDACELRSTDLLLEAIPTCTDNWHKLLLPISYSTLYGKKDFVISVSPDLFRLIGYFLAEGSTSSGLKGKSGYKENKYKFYRVEFAFHEDETEYIDDVSKLMKKFFGVSVSISPRKNSKAVSVTFKTRRGYEFFRENFGTQSYNKHIPLGLQNLGSDCVDQLLIGYWRGDGSSSTIGYSFSSSSASLIHTIRRLMLTRNITSSYSVRTNNQHHSSVINGLEVTQKHDNYQLGIYGESAARFQSIVRSNHYKLSGNRNRVVIDAEYAYYPITSISSHAVDGIIVYNMEVIGDHSYHANGVAVHNCHCLPGEDNSCKARFAHKNNELPDGYDHKYVYQRLGYNMKPTDIQAALGSSQLKRAKKFHEIRKHNWERLLTGLRKYSRYFILPSAVPESDPAWFGFCLTVKPFADFTRNEIVAFLESKKIGTRPLFGGNLIRHPAFDDVVYQVSGDLYNADNIMKSTFWIGVWQGINDEMIDYMLSVFNEFMTGRNKR